LAIVSKSAAPAAEAAVLVVSEAARGPSARTLLPTPAFLKKDLRLNPLFIVCSKTNLPIFCCTWRAMRSCDELCAASPEWPMNTDYSVVFAPAEGAVILLDI
jgi:hypothetical protein